MRRVRIVGGGLTGILAAFQAHSLGARDIELYERLGDLGGVALPRTREGCEMREGCVYFGPQSDPIRRVLEQHGARFEEFDNCFGSVSAGPDGLTYAEDFGGPALGANSLALSKPEGESLADRLQSYDPSLTAPLARYVRWHLGCAPAQLHETACVPLAINRVFPDNVSIDDLARAKQQDALANDLFGIPRAMWGYASNVQASVPLGGFTTLFEHCRRALPAIGVRVHERSLATPKRMLSEETEDDIIVWAASPMPLFKPMGVEIPKAPGRKFATYVFEVNWNGKLPFYVQNFTATGSCFRAYLYPSNGRIFLTAECVQQVDRDALAAELAQMLAGFDGELSVGELMFESLKPRWIYHSEDTIAKLGELRAALRAQRGANFVAGAWEAYAKGEKFAEVQADLAQAMDSDLMVRAS